jgi:hypothetical protein
LLLLLRRLRSCLLLLLLQLRSNILLLHKYVAHPAASCLAKCHCRHTKCTEQHKQQRSDEGRHDGWQCNLNCPGSYAVILNTAAIADDQIRCCLDAISASTHPLLCYCCCCKLCRSSANLPAGMLLAISSSAACLPAYQRNIAHTMPPHLLPAAPAAPVVSAACLLPC